jgi:hypothetical protein
MGEIDFLKRFKLIEKINILFSVFFNGWIFFCREDVRLEEEVLTVLEAASKLRPTTDYRDINQSSEDLDAVADFKTRQVVRYR